MKWRIMKRIKKMKNFILPIYIIGNILYILIGSYLMTIGKFKLNVLAKNYLYLLIANVIVLLLTILIKKKKKEKIIIKKVDIILIFIIIFSVISTIFAINRKVAIYGIGGRYEGLISILYYFSLTMLSSFVEEKHKKMIVYMILITGLIQALYAIGQILQIKHIVRFYHHETIWATGFVENPNFFGTLMLLCFSYSLGLFIDTDKKVIQIMTLLIISEMLPESI